MSPCCEFVTYGKVEFSPDGNVSLEQARCALLPNNPRRCLQTEIILTSCNAHKHGPFVTTNRFTGEVVDKATAGPCPLDETETGVNVATSHSTDFVLRSGTAELFSNNGRCSHFVISNGLCSAPLTSADLIWMEGVAGVPKGTLFKAFRDQQKSSPSELSYDPVTRYRQLAKVLRAPRGTKTAEHLDNLRKSDPLINLPAWLDMRALSEGIKTTAAYKAHQRGLRARASHARTSEAPRAASLSVLTQTMPTVHEEGSEEVDTTYNSRGERRSSDSIMVVDPQAQFTDEDEPECERSPTGVDMLLPPGAGQPRRQPRDKARQTARGHMKPKGVQFKQFAFVIDDDATKIPIASPQPTSYVC